MATTPSLDWHCAGRGLLAGVRRLPDTGRSLLAAVTISRWANAPTLREIIRLTYALVGLPGCGRFTGSRALSRGPSDIEDRSTLCTAISS